MFKIYYTNMEIKEQIKTIENVDIQTINVNRNFVNVTYESDLDDEDIKELFVNKLDNKDLFGFKFEKDSIHDSKEMVDSIKFRIK